MLERFLADAFLSELEIKSTLIQHRMEFEQLRVMDRLERALNSARTRLRLAPVASASMR